MASTILTPLIRTIAGSSEMFLGRAEEWLPGTSQAGNQDAVLVGQGAGRFRPLSRRAVGAATDGKVDFYLLHGLNSTRWPVMRDLGVLDWAERAIAAGRIGHLGFSFHDTYETFQEIVDAYDSWTLCQIQYNFMDEQKQAGVRGLKYAADKGLGVIVMEPLRGGLLAGNTGQRQGQGLPPAIQALWDSAAGAEAPPSGHSSGYGISPPSHWF